MRPADVLVGACEDAAGVTDLSRAGPIARVVDVFLTWPDHVGPKIDAEILGHLLGRVDPCRAAQAGEQGELRRTGQIQRGMFAAVRIKEPSMGDARARPCGRLVVQVRVESEIGLDLAVGDDDVRFVALIHLDPVGVEFVFFERNRGVERVALRFRLRRGAAAGVHVGFDLFGAVILMGLDPVPSILLAGVAALVIAVPTAFFAFRLNGAYFAIGTWVIAEVVRLLVAQWKTLGGGTGTSLPRDATRDMWFVEMIEEALGVRSAAARDILAYWLALILALATIGGIYWLLRTRRGLALAAVRDNTEAAKSVGVDAGRMKWIVFLTSAYGTGLAGGLIYMQKARISPDAAFSVTDWTAYVIFIVVIGGIGTIEGPIIGVLVFFALQSLLADFGSWYLLTLGILAIVIMLVAPRGLWGLLSERTGLHLFPIRRRLSGGKLTLSEE
jgi:branched-chain amino acid transport system permease protein